MQTLCTHRLHIIITIHSQNFLYYCMKIALHVVYPINHSLSYTCALKSAVAIIGSPLCDFLILWQQDVFILMSNVITRYLIDHCDMFYTEVVRQTITRYYYPRLVLECGSNRIPVYLKLCIQYFTHIRKLCRCSSV